MSETTNKKFLKDKKILYLITQTKWGGAQKYVLELAEYFRQHNEVTIAFGEVNNQNPEFLAACQKLNIKTIPVENLVRAIQLGKDFFSIKELATIINKNHYNLIHLNSSKVGLLGTMASQLHNFNPLNIRLRLVYTAHGFVFNEPLSKNRKRLYKLSEKISTGLQNLVITVSDFDKQSAIDNKICAANKMFTVHNGLDFGKYNFHDQGTALKKLNLSPDKKYFGTIASFYATKGYPYLIDAIKILVDKNSPILNDYQWILIGDGPELANIKNKIKRNQLEPYIKIIPPDNRDWKYLKAFAGFILPSVKEGLPYTILEAGLADVPIIASKVGGIPEIITDQKTGLLVTPANPLMLAEAMEKLVNNHRLAANLAQANHKNIKDNFNLQQTLARTEELYLKLFY